MPNYKGIAYLRNKLACKKPRVQLRYAYYDMKNAVDDFRLTTPPQFRHLVECLGWCGKAVDALADRLLFRGFANDNFDLWSIFQMNSADVLFDSAVLSAAISSCSFIYIRAGADGYPQLQVLDGGRATGCLDPITNMLTEGYAVLEVDDHGEPTLEAHFIPGSTTYFPKNKAPYTVHNDAPYPLLVPIIHRPDASRPFGHSRITRACMSILQHTLRTLKRTEISAEFYSFPQKYVLGMDPDAEGFEKWGATMSSFLRFDKDADGDKPELGQFTQMSMSPHIEQLRACAALFAGETGLTMDDLGFVTDNPSSAEAIKASHETLRLAARKAQRSFGTGILNTGYLAACVRDQYPYKRSQLYLTAPQWEPVFEPDAAMLGAIGDGAAKINQAVPGYFGTGNLRELTGIDANG